MKTLIKVKQKHITEARLKTNGRFCPSKHCPIALALKEHFECNSVTVGGGSICYVGNSIVILPRSCTRFINRFDNKKPVKPFNFIFKS